MIQEKSKVSKNTPEGVKEWEVNLFLPESVEEALKLYGEEGTLHLIHSALRINQQRIARDGFASGKTQEEVENDIKAYRPLMKKASVKDRVKELMEELKDEIATDDEFRDALTQVLIEGKTTEALKLLEAKRTEVSA